MDKPAWDSTGEWYFTDLIIQTGHRQLVCKNGSGFNLPVLDDFHQKMKSAIGH